METTDPTYGSDKHGLVWGYLFAPHRAATQVDAEGAAHWLATTAATASESFLWLHFSLSNAASGRWLIQHLELPDAFHACLTGDPTSTRVEQDGDALIGAIHDVLFDFTFDASDVSVVSLCVQPQVLVSARVKPLRSLDRLRASVKAGETFQSPAELLARLLQEQANVLVEIVRHATGRVDAMEDRLLANRVSFTRRDLGSVRRALVRLQRLLAPEPAALFRLLNRPPDWIRGTDHQHLRQAAEELAAAVADSASLGERVRLLQEELAALVDEQTNRTLFVLTVVTVLALPINLVAGLFGMNVGGVPLSQFAGGFWVIVVFLATTTAVLGWAALRRYRE